jgi:hypothetical protein
MNAGSHLDHPHHDRHLALNKRVPIVIGIALLFAVLVVVTDQLWYRAFGFSAAESLALAVGLWAYIALVVLIMTIVGVAVSRDR